MSNGILSQSIANMQQAEATIQSFSGLPQNAVNIQQNVGEVVAATGDEVVAADFGFGAVPPAGFDAFRSGQQVERAAPMRASASTSIGFLPPSSSEQPISRSAACWACCSRSITPRRLATPVRPSRSSTTALPPITRPCSGSSASLPTRLSKPRSAPSQL